MSPFVKLWKYLMAAFGAKIDEKADPKVQIQQAIEEAQRQHQALTQQAAAVIGNQRQLEMKLARQMEQVEQLQGSARQSLVLADQARANGDATKGAEYETTAVTFATQLVSAEKSMEDLKSLHDQALQAAQQAKKAVETNAQIVQKKLGERTRLLSQLEQAKMQEQVSKSLQQMSELAVPGNTPSLDEVRDKIEQRYAKALGSAELAGNSVEGRMLEVEKSTLDAAGQQRLDQIRASMTGQLPASTPELATTVPGCPLWTVRDLLSHLVGLPADALAGNLANAASPDWTHAQIEARRDLSVADLVEEWTANGPAFEASLPDRGFLGWVFTYDVTMHGDDLREALGLPLGTSETHAVVLDGIIERARGRAEGIGTLTLRAGDGEWVLGEGDPQSSLTVAHAGELGRVIGARRDDAAVRGMTWEGDPEPWLPVLPLFRPGR